VPTARKNLRALLFCTIFWLVLLLLGFVLDRPVAQHLHDSGFAARFSKSIAVPILKAPGDFPFTVAVAILLAFTHPRRWRAGVLVCLAGIVSGVNALVKWSTGRIRPFKVKGHPGELLPFTWNPFIGGVSGMYSASNVCFPSGHACLAFATAAMLAMLLPRQRWLFYFGAALVGLERILENAHYVSDVVAAALLGVVGAKLVWLICEPLLLETRSHRGI